ncbi:MAG: HEPN domain-containing protein [Chloroflexota bacterium]|nr:HEPN domain-containing protein [Chloroflexota bacterium]
MNAPTQPFLSKARESLAGAESEFVNARYNSCYYACFQAAIHALMQAGIHPNSDQWGHDFVQAQFVGLLINRRKIYPALLRDVLSRGIALRQIADYQTDGVGQTRAARMLKSTRDFLDVISRK